MKFVQQYLPWWGLWLGLAMVGCGGGKTDVTGEVYLDGQLLGSSSRHVVKVSFVPIEEAGQDKPPPASTADVSEAGSFHMPDLAPGSYVAQVHDFKPYPFNDRLAAYFRQHPDALSVTVSADHPVHLEVQQDWYRQRASSGRH